MTLEEFFKTNSPAFLLLVEYSIYQTHNKIFDISKNQERLAHNCK
ncbi:MAG: hypothetical protein ACI959_000536 [Limisphaerales bacterium]|jgi:hypothetical protein